MSNQSKNLDGYENLEKGLSLFNEAMEYIDKGVSEFLSLNADHASKIEFVFTHPTKHARSRINTLINCIERQIKRSIQSP